ncbi:MAG: hypothetical protein ACOC4Z_00485 [Patescibacteria group bacterium]
MPSCFVGMVEDCNKVQVQLTAWRSLEQALTALQRKELSSATDKLAHAFWRFFCTRSPCGVRNSLETFFLLAGELGWEDVQAVLREELSVGSEVVLHTDQSVLLKSIDDSCLERTLGILGEEFCFLFRTVSDGVVYKPDNCAERLRDWRQIAVNVLSVEDLHMAEALACEVPLRDDVELKENVVIPHRNELSFAISS